MSGEAFLAALSVIAIVLQAGLAGRAASENRKGSQYVWLSLAALNLVLFFWWAAP